MTNTIEEQPVETEFPFDEIRQEEDGDMFDTAAEAMRFTGYDEYHIWSVTEADEEEYNGERWQYRLYGPLHHFVNVLGFIATKERHDGDTYFEECFSMGESEKT